MTQPKPTARYIIVAKTPGEERLLVLQNPYSDANRDAFADEAAVRDTVYGDADGFQDGFDHAVVKVTHHPAADGAPARFEFETVEVPA